MKEKRSGASCVVFEGRIVVTGGFNNNNGDLNTVEVYDHIDDSWTNMPNMVETRSDYKTVAIKNKLFIVGVYFNTYIEVFDSCSNNFVLLKNTFRSLRHTYVSDITTLGNRILIFNNNNGYEQIYDVESGEWIETICRSLQHIKFFSCAKIPKLQWKQCRL